MPRSAIQERSERASVVILGFEPPEEEAEKPEKGQGESNAGDLKATGKGAAKVPRPALTEDGGNG